MCRFNTQNDVILYYKLGKKFFSKDITPIIYEIDNSTHIIDKLFIDVNYDKRVYYTLNNIPKDKIKIVKIDN